MSDDKCPTCDSPLSVITDGPTGNPGGKICTACLSKPVKVESDEPVPATQPEPGAPANGE